MTRQKTSQTDLHILLLSGPLAVGKSSVAGNLEANAQFTRVRSSSYLSKYANQYGLAADRQGLQALGDRLDVETDYRWLIDDVVAPTLKEQSQQQRWLIDAVRKRRQVDHFRQAYPEAIYHAHLSAPEEVLRRRYDARATSGSQTDLTPYDVAIQHPNELASRDLIETADIVVDVSVATIDGVSAEILKRMRLS